MNLLVMRKDYSIVCGTTITRDPKTGGGSSNRQHFSETCLVRTHTEPAAYGHLTFVRPGTLDVARDIIPSVQIWTRSAMR
jgi:glutathione-dependent formaldehyde-activating enzyme